MKEMLIRGFFEAIVEIEYIKGDVNKLINRTNKIFDEKIGQEIMNETGESHCDVKLAEISAKIEVYNLTLCSNKMLKANTSDKILVVEELDKLITQLKKILNEEKNI